jgi:hypothetical protein
VSDQHDHDHREHRRNRGSIGQLVTNWNEYEASFGKKLALAARNLTWGRLRHRTCCGHDGQPGC